MDLITQGLLGAVVGQAGFQKRLGKRAMLWGAIGGLLPDADMIAVKVSSHPMAMELIHRGLTHSVFFAPLMAVPLGLLLCWIDAPLIGMRRRNLWSLLEYAKPWIHLSFWALITHPLLDLFTTFGVQLLAPFSNHRFALSAIPIIDPIYSVPMIVSLVGGTILSNRYAAISGFIGKAVLFFTSAYLFLGLVQHDKAMDVARAYCQSNNLSCHRIEAFPMIPSIYAQRLLVETNNHVYVTEYSTWNQKMKPWIYMPKENLPTPILTSEAFRVFQWFTNGLYVVKNQTIEGACVLDSRYGSLEHRPFGLFSMCFGQNGVIKNADYDEPQSTFSAKIKNYAKIIHDLWVWTFAKI